MLDRRAFSQATAACLLIGMVLALWALLWLKTPLPPHNQARLVQLGLSALATLTLLGHSLVGPGSRKIGSISSDPLPALLLLSALASWAFAPHHAVSAQDVALHLGLVALALAVAQAEAPNWRCMFDRGLAVGPMWLAALTATLYLAALLNQQPLNARQLHLAFENPRFLNHAQTLFVPWLVLVFASDTAHGRLRHLALLAAGFHVGLAYLDVARGTGLSWMVALAVLWVAGARREAQRFAWALAGGVLFGVVAFDLLPAMLGRSWDVPFARASEIGLAHSRNTLWAQSLAMIEASPWFGQGPMEFAALPDARGAHPHNIYLQWACEYGVPATLLGVALLLRPIFRALDVSVRTSRSVGLAAVCAAGLADGGVSGNFVMPVSQLWLACMYGQMLARRAPHRQHRPSLPVYVVGPAKRPEPA